MADLENENIIGFVDRRASTAAGERDLGATGKHKALQTTNFANNADSVGALRARLTAISATTYTVARLNLMTKNDMVYAVRLSDEPLSV